MLCGEARCGRCEPIKSCDVGCPGNAGLLCPPPARLIRAWPNWFSNSSIAIARKVVSAQHQTLSPLQQPHDFRHQVALLLNCNPLARYSGDLLCFILTHGPASEQLFTHVKSWYEHIVLMDIHPQLSLHHRKGARYCGTPSYQYLVNPAVACCSYCLYRSCHLSFNR